ncbi:MAG: DUF2760 domain-containing protein [Pirellulales bacterium]|nr:DUF2760 domain-containing protein [Pirellulales bacterium]
MRRIILAIRAFFGALCSAATAREIEQALCGGPAEPPQRQTEPKRPSAPPPPARSEAVTLLSTLQREARFIDFIQESLEGYSDAQIGAAARDVHRDCAKVLLRLFAIRPIHADEEGAEVEVSPGFDAGRYRLTGNVVGEPPFRGPLVHHGWEAAKCELPAWSGSRQAARVIAPVEVELK